MTSWSDDFNRANGTLGNGWSTIGGTIRIDNNIVICSGAGYAHRARLGPAGFQHVRVDGNRAQLGNYYPNLILCYDPTNNHRYQLTFNVGTYQFIMNVYKYTSLVPQDLGVGYLPNPVGGWHTMDFVYDDGELRGYLDGTLCVTAHDSELADHPNLGFRMMTAYSQADNFYYDDIPSAALDVEPEPIVELGPDPELTFTGTDTNWTPGTPGAPIFTVDKGTLTDQSVQSPTQATANYHLPVHEEDATFTDPSTGQTDVVHLSSSLNVQAGEDLTEVLRRLGEFPIGDDVLTWLQHVLRAWEPPPDFYGALDLFNALEAVNPVQNLSGIFDDFYAALYNYLPPTARGWQALMAILAFTVKARWQIDGLQTDVQAIRGEPYHTFVTAINAICGVPNYTVKEVADLLAALTTGGTYNLASVIAEILLTRGAGGHTIAELYDRLMGVEESALTDLLGKFNLLTSNDLYKLGDLMQRIDEVRGTNNPTIHDVLVAIANLDPFQPTDLTAIVNKLNLMHTGVSPSLQTVQTDTTEIIRLLNANFPIAQPPGPSPLDLLNTILTIATQLQQLIGGGVNVNLQPVLDHLTAIRTPFNYTFENIGRWIDAPAWLARQVKAFPGDNAVNWRPTVALENGMVYDAPVHGFKLNITEPGEHPWAYQHSGITRYGRLGVVTFQDSQGYREEWQPVAWAQGVYTPKTIVNPAGLVIQCKPGTKGWVYPWYLT